MKREAVTPVTNVRTGQDGRKESEMLSVENVKEYGFTHFAKADESTLVVFGSEEHRPMAMENAKGVQAKLKKEGLTRSKTCPDGWTEGEEPEEANQAPATAESNEKPKKAKKKAAAKAEPAEPKEYASRSAVPEIREASNALGGPPLYFDTFETYRECVWRDVEEEKCEAAAKMLTKEFPKCRVRVSEGRLVLIIPRFAEEGGPTYDTVAIPYAKNISVGLDAKGNLTWMDKQGGKFTGNTEVSKEALADAFATIHAALWS